MQVRSLGAVHNTYGRVSDELEAWEPLHETEAAAPMRAHNSQAERAAETRASSCGVWQARGVHRQHKSTVHSTAQS